MKTETVFHADGSREVLRVPDVFPRAGGASPAPTCDPMGFETSIVWLQPLDGLDFVRVAVVRRARNRRGPLLAKDGLVLGYSRLAGNAPRDPETKCYVRRLFYLREEDSLLNGNQFPPGAVDPRTVLPGVMGQPPNLAELDRGYPRHMCRAQLGLPIPAIVAGPLAAEALSSPTA